jgi:HSP20 family protein
LTARLFFTVLLFAALPNGALEITADASVAPKMHQICRGSVQQSPEKEIVMAKETKETKETKPAIRSEEEGAFGLMRPLDIDTMFNDWFTDFWSRRSPWSLRRSPWFQRATLSDIPAVDVYDQNDELIVKAEIPGLEKDEVDVSIEGNTLTIKGEKHKEHEVKHQDYYRAERTFGAFSRSVELPVSVQTDKVNATFKNGVLEIRLPKSEEAKKSVIKVKVA